MSEEPRMPRTVLNHFKSRLLARASVSLDAEPTFILELELYFGEMRVAQDHACYDTQRGEPVTFTGGYREAKWTKGVRAELERLIKKTVEDYLRRKARRKREQQGQGPEHHQQREG